jgi:FG-GAP-like repeat
MKKTALAILLIACQPAHRTGLVSPVAPPPIGNLVAAGYSVNSGQATSLATDPSGHLLTGSNSFYPNVIGYNDGSGGGTYGSVVGDFNLDGHQDVAIANAAAGTISVYLGNGLGGLTLSASMTAGNSPRMGCTADFNLDGKPDLAFTNRTDSTVSVYFGNGNGTFGTQNVFAGVPNNQGIGCSSMGTQSTTVSIVVGSRNSPAIGVLQGYGDGGFAATVAFDGGANEMYQIVLKDMDNDGYQDIVTTGYGTQTANVIFGSSSPTVFNATNVTVPLAKQGGAFLAVADLNGDGIPDIVAMDNQGFNIFYGTDHSSGSNYYSLPYPDLYFKVTVVNNAFISGVQVADVNGDGWLDIIGGIYDNYGDTVNGLQILSNNGAGGFSVLPVIQNGSSTVNPIQSDATNVGDFNEDGRPDFVVGNFVATATLSPSLEMYLSSPIVQVAPMIGAEFSTLTHLFTQRSCQMVCCSPSGTAIPSIIGQTSEILSNGGPSTVWVGPGSGLPDSGAFAVPPQPTAPFVESGSYLVSDVCTAGTTQTSPACLSVCSQF